MSVTNQTVIKKLKRVAKKLEKESPELAHSQALNSVASLLGYNNWSLLSKHVSQMSPSAIDDFHDGLYFYPKLAGKLSPQYAQVDPKIAVEEMQAWVSTNFTKLIEFAFYDNESENGFSWPSADLNNALQEEFNDKYPLALIEKVAEDLESEGPWGDYPYDEVADN